MLKRNANSYKYSYRPCILLGIILPADKIAERDRFDCLYKAGSSGYLETGMPLRIPK